MTGHWDPSRLERVVPGPEYPPSRTERADRIANRIVLLIALVGALIIVAASRGEPESSHPQSPAEPAGVEREGTTQALLGAPPRPSSTEAGQAIPADVLAAPRYRGTATWYCLSGSSTCTRGYSGSDLVAAIDTDLGFEKGDRVTVRYRGNAVTVTVVDTCGCPGERLIDLTSGAFRRLAPLGHGVIPVTLELASAGSTLPPTDEETTP